MLTLSSFHQDDAGQLVQGKVSGVPPRVLLALMQYCYGRVTGPINSASVKRISFL
uniref:Uncharacterized protein n=1 Tax=Utricularia reniformis TaxID=192314 RepID=A0A1Y0B355_9LAMI|nr:hypothetical protein AEK19_MT1629 [Utricularia reniformis]ART31813.1 hypothetical protein AEK19_MT1629 [Utricularia reniformis]